MHNLFHIPNTTCSPTTLFLPIDNIVLLRLTHHNIHTLSSPTVLLTRSLHIHTHSQNCAVRTLQSLKAFLTSLSLSPKSSSFLLTTTSLSPGWIDMIANVTTTRRKKRKRLKTLLQSVVCVCIHCVHTTTKQAIVWIGYVVYDCLNTFLKRFNNLILAALQVNQGS